MRGSRSWTQRSRSETGRSAASQLVSNPCSGVPPARNLARNRHRRDIGGNVQYSVPPARPTSKEAREGGKCQDRCIGVLTDSCYSACWQRLAAHQSARPGTLWQPIHLRQLRRLGISCWRLPDSYIFKGCRRHQRAHIPTRRSHSFPEIKRRMQLRSNLPIRATRVGGRVSWPYPAGSGRRSQ